MNKRSYICLYDIPLFSGLDKASFPMICKASNKLYKQKGELLFNQGDPADSVYIIKEGSFKLVHITKEGGETIIQIMGPGEVIGETAFFRPNTYQPVSAIALEESKVCSFDCQNFENIIKIQPDMAYQIIKNLSNRLYDTWEHIAESNTQTIQEKVLSLFIRLAREYGEPCQEGTIIKMSLTQQEIASYVGASRVMVSQVLGELVDKKYLSKDKKHYVLRKRCF